MFHNMENKEEGCRDSFWHGVPLHLDPRQMDYAYTLLMNEEKTIQGSLACLALSTFHYMNNHVHSAPQEHIERERKDSEHRKNTQNIHNITTIHKPHGLEKWGGIKMVVQ